MYKKVLFVCVVTVITSKSHAGIFSKFPTFKKNAKQKSSSSSNPVIDYFVPDYHWLNYFSPMLGFIHYGKGEEDPSFYFYNSENNAKFKFIDPNVIEQREIEKAIEHKYLEEEVIKKQMSNQQIPPLKPHVPIQPLNPPPLNQVVNPHLGNQIINQPLVNQPYQIVNQPLGNQLGLSQTLRNFIFNQPLRQHILNYPLRNQIFNQPQSYAQTEPNENEQEDVEQHDNQSQNSDEKEEKEEESESQQPKENKMEEKEELRVKEIIDNLRQVVMDIRNFQQQQARESTEISKQKETPTTTTTTTTTTEKPDDQIKVIESLHQLVQKIREIQQLQAQEAEELRRQKLEVLAALEAASSTAKPVDRDQQSQLMNPSYESVSKPQDFVEEPGFYYVFLKKKSEPKPAEEEKREEEIQQETIITVPEVTTYKPKFRSSSFTEYLKNNIPKLVNNNINEKDTENSDQFSGNAISYFIQEMEPESTQSNQNSDQVYIIENPKVMDNNDINMVFFDTSPAKEISNSNNNDESQQNQIDYSDGKREKFAYRIRHHLDDSKAKIKNYWYS